MTMTLKQLAPKDEGMSDQHKFALKETPKQEDFNHLLPHLPLELEEKFVHHSHVSDEKRQDAHTTFANAVLLT